MIPQLDAELLAYASPEELRALEKAYSIEIALSGPLAFAHYVSPGTESYKHLIYLDGLIVALVEHRLYADGPGIQGVRDEKGVWRHPQTGVPVILKLMVSMPPRHGKSYLISEHAPAWYLARYPENRVLLASYEADFAASWGLKARRHIENHPEFGLKLDQSSRSGARWDLDGRRGGMGTAGAGGPLVGRGMHFGVVDDPLKNAEEAMSQSVRDGQENWWHSTFYSRAEPDAVVLLVMCMAGDTQVLMADGTEMALRNVRVGDAIATYEQGHLSVSTVRNWANQGPDTIYLLRMKSGVSVRANARHPFLTVENGVEAWRQLQDLSPGDVIVCAMPPGGSGSESNVQRTGVHPLPSAKACAWSITAKHDGQLATGHRLPMQTLDDVFGSRDDTESHPRSMTVSSQSKKAGALSAEDYRKKSINRSIGGTSSASIMTTTQGSCEDFFATTATLSSDEGTPLPFSVPPLSTWRIGQDEVESIVLDGCEDVFDIQVDRTENFIANGLTAHNTRWHEDDIGGRLSEGEPDKWFVVNLPALAEENDPLGREEGEALCPERYPKAQLESLRDSPMAGGRLWFSALYQGRPSIEDSGMFPRNEFRFYTKLSKGYNLITDSGDEYIESKHSFRFVTVDLAASTKTSADWSVFSCWDACPGNRLILVDRWRGRLEQPDHKTKLQEFVKRNQGLDDPKMRFVGVEKATYGLGLIQQLIREPGFIVRPLSPDKDKISRAIPAGQAVCNHQIFFPKDAPWIDEWCMELVKFPNARHDDMVDTLAYAVDIWQDIPVSIREPKQVPVTTDERALAALKALDRKSHRKHPVLGRW